MYKSRSIVLFGGRQLTHFRYCRSFSLLKKLSMASVSNETCSTELPWSVLIFFRTKSVVQYADLYPRGWSCTGRAMHIAKSLPLRCTTFTRQFRNNRPNQRTTKRCFSSTRTLRASLVIAEHDNNALLPATLNTVSAAAAIGKDIDIAVLGHNAQAAASAAAKVAGVRKVIHLEHKDLEHPTAESLTEVPYRIKKKRKWRYRRMVIL